MIFECFLAAALTHCRQKQHFSLLGWAVEDPQGSHRAAWGSGGREQRNESNGFLHTAGRAISKAILCICPQHLTAEFVCPLAAVQKPYNVIGTLQVWCNLSASAYLHLPVCPSLSVSAYLHLPVCPSLPVSACAPLSVSRSYSRHTAGPDDVPRHLWRRAADEGAAA